MAPGVYARDPRPASRASTSPYIDLPGPTPGSLALDVVGLPGLVLLLAEPHEDLVAGLEIEGAGVEHGLGVAQHDLAALHLELRHDGDVGVLADLLAGALLG